jgi:acetyl/propionyl-CoA carboxylase alpha subunit
VEQPERATELICVTRMGHGLYAVDRDGKRDVVYAAGTGADTWVFWNGWVFHGDKSHTAEARSRPRSGTASLEPLVAPMPATVRSVLVQPGAFVTMGQALIVVEAMKMELSLRAPADATVSAVRCREGELVQADAVLIEFQPTYGSKDATG